MLWGRWYTFNVNYLGFFFVSYTYTKTSVEEGKVPGKPVVQPIHLILPLFRAVRLEGSLESVPCFNHFNTNFSLQDDPGRF